MAMQMFDGPAEGGVASPPSVHIDGIEVSQTVQNLAHDVPLIAGKRTVVRVYLSGKGDDPIALSGELHVHTDSSPLSFVPSVAPLTIPAGDTPLAIRRGDIDRSLNFVLPAELTTPGPVEIVLGRADEQGTGRACALGGEMRRVVAFEPAPPLRLRLVGFRYVGARGTRHAPRAIDFALLLSWLRRAYPVAEVTATQLVVSTTWRPPFDVSVPNAQLAALRTQDLVDGTDDRVHYLGLVASEGFFMRGAATYVPASADPSTVASAPTGRPTGQFEWDTDESSGDWYGGHELAHTLGRLHPGFCDQTHDDPAFPYAEGHISNGSEFVGLDVGDPDVSIPMRALPGNIWHDVMTYCAYQWVSPYTYVGLLARLREEEHLVNGPDVVRGEQVEPAAAAGPDGRTAIHVVARVDLLRGEGEIMFAVPVPGLQRPERFVADARDPDGQGALTSRSVQLRLVSRDGSVERVDAPIRFNTDTDEVAESLGLVDVVLTVSQDLDTLQLAWDGEVRTELRIGAAAQAPADIVVNLLDDARPEDGPAGLDAVTSARKRLVEWAHPGADDTRYTVKVSDDQGGSWQTIAVDQPTPTVELDPAQFASPELKLRVLATNGLHVDTRQFDVSFADDELPT